MAYLPSQISSLVAVSDIGTSVLAPTGTGSGLTGITISQVFGANPIFDGTYNTGLGASLNMGTITTVNGVITAISPAS